MKNFFLINLMVFCTFVSSKKEGNGCIDSDKIGSGGICNYVYEPVCGCDGKTYPNECEAANKGVTSYASGECPD